MASVSPAIGKIAAQMASGAVNDVAEDLGAISRAELGRHRRTGASSIVVEKGRIDSRVVLVDDAAEAIEFGNARVPGLHVLGRHL